MPYLLLSLADKHPITMYLPARHITLIVFSKNQNKKCNC